MRVWGALLAVVAALVLAACGGSGHGPSSLSDGSKCSDWSAASGTVRAAYVGPIYDRIRRYASRLNVARYVVQSNITRECRRHPDARLGSVRGSCEKYVIDCKPVSVPPYLSGGPARTDKEIAQNVDVVSTAIEACWVGETVKDYRACKRPSGVRVTMGDGLGHVQVVTVERKGYSLLGRAPDGSSFWLEKRGGGIGAYTKRTCTPAGRPPCRADGTWKET